MRSGHTFHPPKQGFAASGEIFTGIFPPVFVFRVSRERYARRVSSQNTSFLETKISALFMCGGRQKAPPHEVYILRQVNTSLQRKHLLAQGERRKHLFSNEAPSSLQMKHLPLCK